MQISDKVKGQIRQHLNNGDKISLTRNYQLTEEINSVKKKSVFSILFQISNALMQWQKYLEIFGGYLLIVMIFFFLLEKPVLIRHRFGLVWGLFGSGFGVGFSVFSLGLFFFR